MKRKIQRGEMRDTVVNLIDLGFTVGVVAFMVGSSVVNVYAHLKKAGRMTGRVIKRGYPSTVNDGSAAAMRKVFSDPQWQALPMLALARQAAVISGPAEVVSPPKAANNETASVIRLTSRKSAKKAA